MVEALVWTLAVVEGEILGQPEQQFGQGGVALEVDVLVLDAVLETLAEDTVQGPSAPIHADGDAGVQEHP